MLWEAVSTQFTPYEFCTSHIIEYLRINYANEWNSEFQSIPTSEYPLAQIAGAINHVLLGKFVIKNALQRIGRRDDCAMDLGHANVAWRKHYAGFDYSNASNNPCQPSI